MISTTSNRVLALQQVGKVYRNGTIALQDANLAIAPGEFVSLVGASGCGKSTILRLIAGLGQPSTGNIHWDRPEQAQDLAFVFQDAALMPWATVLDNVRLPLTLNKTKPNQARATAQDVINLVGLAGFESAYPRELSGGMRMRVSIARSLVTTPQVLLMDEPFGALDEMTRSKLNSDLLHLWQQKRWTVVFVTHNIYEAVYLSQRVVVMAPRPGRIHAEIPIDAPYPRDEDFRTSPEYINHCRAVAAQLHTAMQDAEIL
ncbi:ABC transporter ATP-binding protein [Spirulina major]|uniref:ABC transporter ATP-binding protein n=1 Tax=Spirulina major TaxID=270636 RepID=UPI000932A1C6|nr:ABC transporter ATP-binding protein [Spirulina major]